MTPTELREKCEQQQALQHRPDASVYLSVKRMARGDHVRLFGRRGPLGYVCAWVDGWTSAIFKADQVLAALDRMEAEAAKNIGRVWGEPDAEGVVEHVAEAAA